MKSKITKRLVDAAQADPARDILIWDTETAGFGLRVSRGGVKSYVFQYKIHGRARRMTLGEHGRALTLDAARKLAVSRRLAVQAGGDPATEAETAAAAPTVRDLAARYLKEHASKRSASTRRAAEMLFRLYHRKQLARLGAALDQEPEGSSSVAALRFCLLTGCRPGEALAARWEDVDLSARVWRLPAAKTGPRAVYLGTPAVEVLSGLLKAGSWLFAGRGGTDAPLSSLRALWERVAIRAELPQGLRLYDATRHTFATMAAELEVPRDVRQLLMGHAAGKEAHDRYNHATAVLFRAADLVSGWLRSALAGEPEPSAKVLPMRT